MRCLQVVSKVVLRVGFEPKELAVPSLLLQRRATGLQKMLVCVSSSRG
jgi:hypothetical protein